MIIKTALFYQKEIGLPDLKKTLLMAKKPGMFDSNGNQHQKSKFFFTSTRGYGILWDNYSHSKWAFPVTPDYVSPDRLYDIKGHLGGLTGTYYNGLGFTDLKAERIDSTISFDFKYFGAQRITVFQPMQIG